MQHRRDFIQCAAAAGIGTAIIAGCQDSAPDTGEKRAPSRIIDTHTHFYDPSRPQGVPWPPKNEPRLYRTVLPRDYCALPVARHADATVVVEASEWVEDNQWILDLAAHDRFIAGLVGNLPVGTAEFPALLKRFAANPRFRGIRLHDNVFRKLIGKPELLEHLRLLPRYDLEFDANVVPGTLLELAKIAREIPDLRIVINHIANVGIDGKEPPEVWRRGMGEAAACANVCCKFSNIVEGSGKRDGSAPRAVEFYRKTLDVVWAAFGEDRLIYGSNWPVSELFAPLETVQALALEYVGERGPKALEKVFWKNAVRVYKCSV
jgi:predicted TIM-barrel fold metal-dependent hydrolase